MHWPTHVLILPLLFSHSCTHSDLKFSSQAVNNGTYLNMHVTRSMREKETEREKETDRQTDREKDN